MKTLIFSFAATLTLLFSSCMKHANDYEPVMGEALNTWTFKEGSKTYTGVFLVSPVLHTTIQSNNTYTLDMTGIQKGSGQLLTMAISLTDLDFTVKSYKSGISGSDHATSFSYSGSAGSRNAIYSSSNNDPGAVMTYDISHYNPAKNTVTITFSGQVFDASGNLMNISKGKITAHVDRK